MDQYRLPQQARRQKALERLGYSEPRCGVCGEDDPRCLEAHHPAGRAYDPTTGLVCRNCHRKLSDVQLDHPGKLSDPPSFDERLGHFLLGLADFLTLVIERLQSFAKELIERARAAQGGV